MKYAVIAGATGLVGTALVRQALNDPRIDHVTVLVRRSLNINHPKLEEQRIDFDQLEQASIPRGADVYCALGTTIKKAKTREAFERVDLHYPLQLASLAKAEDARQFLVITATGANRNSIFFYNRVKGELEAQLRALQLPSLQIFRPSLLIGEREEFRLGERVGAIAGQALRILMIGRLARYRPIHAAVVAQAMLTSAGREHSGMTVYESEMIRELAHMQA